MKHKLLEVRDNATCIPVLATQMVVENGVEDKFLWRYGYPRTPPYSILLSNVSSGEGHVDPYDWGGSYTMTCAHEYIINNFDDLENGQVVDIRVFARLTEKEPASPEIYIP